MNETLIDALSGIAEAIRAKGVTGTMNAWQMPQKIASIPTGGGSKYGITLDGILGDVDENGALQRGGEPFSFSSSEITSIPGYYFDRAFFRKNIQSIDLPNLTTIGTETFINSASQSSLSSVSMPELSAIPDFGLQYAFRHCSALESVDLDSVQTVGESGLQGCCFDDPALVRFNAPSISSVGQGGMYRCLSGCTSLEEVCLSSLTSAGNQGLDECFMGCTSLKKVQMPLSNAGTNALRGTFNGCSALEEVDFSEATSVPTLSNINCFANTNETYRILVPDSLYSQWIAASGWSAQGVVEHIMRATDANTLTFTANQAGSTVAMNAVGAAPSISLEYSTDHGDTWNDFTVGSTTITLSNVGDKANIRAKTPNSVMATGENVRNTFSITGEVTVSGNLAAILNKDVEQGKVLDSSTNQHLRGLFRGCSNLVGSAKKLVIPFETLYTDSLDQTFRDCSRMTEAPELPFTTTGTASCFQMFAGCRSLVSPPSTLRPDEIGVNTYRAMFQNCTSLISAPVINATASGQQSFMDMFNGCSSLENAPDILVSTLIGREPARYMFQRSGIRKLVFPNLVQIGSGSSNYAQPLGQMCYGCPNLEEVYMPNLTTVTNNQTANDMFRNCTSLKLVDWRNLSNVEAANNLNNSFLNTPALQILDLHLSQAPFVLTTGTTTFRGTNPHARILVPTGQLSAWKATSGWNNRNVVQHITPYHNELTLSATDGDLTISYTKGENETQTYLYSLDGGSSWTEWAAGDEVVVEDGSEMKVMGFNDNGPDEMNFHIQGTGCVVSGNIMSLVRGMNEDGDDMAERYGYHILDEIPHDGETIGSFKGLFKNCTAIVDAKKLELPATHLVSDMYEEMFMGCSNLVNGPFIPKTESPDTGGYYVRMFSGCSSLQWVGLGMDTIPSAPFDDWLDNAGTGDIWFVGDSSYVPSGWTQTGLKSIIEMNGADEICDTHVFSDFLNFHIELGIGGNAQGDVLFGHKGNNDNNDFRLFSLTDGRLFFDLGNARLQQTNAWDTTEPWYEVELDNFSLKWKKPSDATWSQLTGTSMTFIRWDANQTFNIGYYRQNRQDVRCHYLRIYDGQTLLCDFVPCEDINGLPAIYDKVSGSWSYSYQNNSYVY